MSTRAVRVLLVSATEKEAETVRDLLRNTGTARFDVAWTAAIPEALDRLARHEIDACLVAARVGDQDGLDLVRQARERGRTTPIVVLGEQDDTDTDLKAMRAGAHDFLSRARLDATRLERSIRYAIGRQVVEDDLREANANLSARVRELEQRIQENAHLGQMGNLLQSALCEEEAYAVVGGYARRLFPGGAGALFVANPARNRLDAVATWGEGEIGETPLVPDRCWALRNSRIHRFDPDTPASACPHAGTMTAQTVTLCVPLASREGVLGLLHLRTAAVAPPGAGAPLTGPEHQLAVTLAEQVAIALVSLRMKDTLRRQSIRDALTGLFNRRYLEESMAREIFRAHRKGSPMGVAMIDLDHFKQFNDANGHLAGDILLRTFGEYLLTHIRGEDIACRYGGEEFALITPDASLENTVMRCEQIRDGAARIVIDVGGRPLKGVTISIGVASFPDHGTTLDSLLRTADAALYAAKEAGRNRVARAPDPA